MAGLRRAVLLPLLGLAAAAIATGAASAGDNPNTWTKGVPLPAGRFWPGATTGGDGRIYVIGGFGHCSPYPCNSVYAYDPAKRTWSERAPLPTPRASLAVVTGSDGRIYAIGGSDGNGPVRTVEAYDLHSNTWRTVAPMHSARALFGVASAADGRIYVFSDARAPSTQGEAYDPKTDAWIDLPPMPAPRTNPSAAAGPDGRIYVIGGKTGADPVTIGTVGTVDVYDPQTSSWTHGPSLSTPRSDLVAVKGSDGRIYAIGGRGLCYTYPCATVEVLDIHAGFWTPVAPVPRPRLAFAAAATPDGHIYVIGGIDDGTGDIQAMTSVEVYTAVPASSPLPTPAPTTVPINMPVASLPTTRSSLAAVTSMNGLIYAIGGTSTLGADAKALSAVDAYDVHIDQWVSIAPLHMPRLAPAATAGQDGRIYVLGGISTYCHGGQVRILRSVENYDSRTNRWTKATSLPHPRIGLAAATDAAGRIYAIGGSRACTGEGGTYANTLVEAFNPKTMRWKTRAHLLSARTGLAAVTGKDGLIYAIGGKDALNAATNDLEAYNPSKNRWTRLAPMPSSREGFTAAVGADGRIYVVGGYVLNPGGHSGRLGPPSPVDAYDPKTNRWTAVGLTLTSRANLAAVRGPDGRIYAMGGDAFGGVLGTVEVYSVGTVTRSAQ